MSIDWHDYTDTYNIWNKTNFKSPQEMFDKIYFKNPDMSIRKLAKVFGHNRAVMWRTLQKLFPNRKLKPAGTVQTTIQALGEEKVAAMTVREISELTRCKVPSVDAALRRLGWVPKRAKMGRRSA